MDWNGKGLPIPVMSPCAAMRGRHGTSGRESAARARHAGGPHAKGAGRTRGGTAAEAARLAGRRGAEAEGARGEGQPGFDSRDGCGYKTRGAFQQLHIPLPR